VERLSEGRVDGDVQDGAHGTYEVRKLQRELRVR
jgi:hypothetical protein